MPSVGALARGLAAGAAGTAAMDGLLFARYRRDGGTTPFTQWEFSSSVSNWAEAPAQAQVGKRLVESLFQVQLGPERVPLLSNVTHWSFGMLSGAQYGLVAESLEKPRIGYGLLFGAVVWASTYVVLPAFKVYKPIWEYHFNTLAKDLSAHFVYGLTTATAFRLLSAP
jgi:hypothetical protein